MPGQLSKAKAISFHLSVFILTCLLFFIANFITGKGIYQDVSILKGDSITEYINFLAYLQRIMEGDLRELFYSFSMMPGGGTALVWGWHLISPFNVLLIFFQKSQLLTAYYVIELLKVATCGLTMSIFLIRHCVPKETIISFSVLLKVATFSLSYAFCGFITAHTHDIMWLDGILMLPLLASSLYTLVKNNKVIPFFICLMYCIITNFYIGFMMCIFSTICFAYICIKMKEYRLCIVLNFVLTSGLSAGASAAALFPIMYQVLLSKMSDKNDKLFDITHLIREVLAVFALMTLVHAVIYLLCKSNVIKKLPSYLQKIVSFFTIALIAFLLKKLIDDMAWTGDFLYKTYCLPLKLLIGTYSFEESQTSDLMNIYLGLFLTLAFIMYLFDYRCNSRVKIINIETLLLSVLMMGCVQINYVWHGFTHPLGNFYRWSYMFSFFIIYVSAEYILSASRFREPFSLIHSLSSQGGFCFFVTIGIILMFSTYYYKKNNFVFLSKHILLINIVFILLYLTWYLIAKKRIAFSTTLLSFVIFMELTINAILSMNGWEFLSNAEFESYIDTSSKIMQVITKDSAEEFRTESSYHPMYYYISGYNSVFHHSSAYIRDNLDFMALFGMNGSEMMGGQRCDNKFDLDLDLASFLGIRYLVTEQKLSIPEYSFLEQYEDNYLGKQYYLYENKNAMPMVFTIDEAFNQWISYSDLDLDNLKQISVNYSSKPSDTGLKATGTSQYYCHIDVSDSQSVIFTFPYDLGWKAFVDGQEIIPTKAFGYFLSIQTGNGSHDITIKYVPPYLLEGIIVSIISLILFYVNFRDN